VVFDSSVIADGDGSSLLCTEIYVPNKEGGFEEEDFSEDSLQRQEAHDRAVAEALQRQFDESLRKKSGENSPVKEAPGKSMDEAVAEALQRQFDQSYKKRQEIENEETMRTTNTGKALHFTQLMVANHDQMILQFLSHDAGDIPDDEHPAEMFSLVNVDDMVFLAEKVFELQEQFKEQGKDVAVDVGYHYTHSANMNRIRTDGLLTNAERQAHMIRSTNGMNGSIFGDGIYTGNNPFSYHNFGGGDIGLLVCRLKGAVEVSQNEVDIKDSGHTHETADTLIGRPNKTDEVCVLSSSKQCVALVQFNSSLVKLNDDTWLGNQLVYEYHRSIQAIVDECFNSGCAKTKVRSYFPSQVTIRTLLTGTAAIKRTATTYSKTLQEIIMYTAPVTVKRESNGSLAADPKANPFCLVLYYNGAHEGKSDTTLFQSWTYHVAHLPQKFLFACGTTFYIAFSKKTEGGVTIPLAWPDIYDNETILRRIRDAAEKHCKKCVKCRKATGKGKITIGSMPTGTMRIDNIKELVCPGHPKGTIVVSYKFGEGQRPEYDENPGQDYKSTFRLAYVPDNQAGRDLVKRLKFAFTRGLTFKIGTSLTTGEPNSIVWDSIPHKTTLDATPFGFPDDGYIPRANETLDVLGVPAAEYL